jgi:hypothetical protein
MDGDELMLATAASPDAGTFAYTWIFVVVGTITILGAFFAFARWGNKHIAGPLRAVVGADATPVSDMVPSMIERIQDVRAAATEAAVTAAAALQVARSTQQLVAKIDRALSPNGGATLADSIRKNERRTDEIAEHVQTIVDEVHPDSGTSLRDAVEKIVGE